MTIEADALGPLEHRLGVLLRIGIMVSATTLAAGLGLWLLLPGRPEGNWLLEAGFVALMATPILRVVVSLVSYVRMRDWFFVFTTLAVLLVLAVTLLTARLR
jgi:uncharacterized membrane protein